MKLSDSKKKAIRYNKNSFLNEKRKSKKNPIDTLEKKCILFFAICFCLVLLGAVFSYIKNPKSDSQIPENYTELSHFYDNEIYDFDDEQTIVEKEDVVPSNTEPVENKRAISCWGDSYTVAPNDNIASYAGVLSQLSNRTVYNIGTPLDSLKVIAGRQGGTPLVTTPFTIPADKTSVEIAIDSSEGGRMYLDFTKNGGLNPVKIAGVSGLISKIDDKYYFTRDASGSQTMLLEPTEIFTRAMELRRSDICVFFVGSDSSEDDPELMAKLYRSMADYLEEENKAYLVVSPIVGDPDKLDSVDARLAQEFGNNYFNLREYLCGGVDESFLNDYTAEEQNDANNGIVPERYFFTDEKMYLNQLGAEVVGSAIYEKLLNLGYFKN